MPGGDDGVEMVVGELLIQLLGAVRFETRDILGAPDGIHDLDLKYCCETVAVEVTQITNSRRLRQDSALLTQDALSEQLERHWDLETNKFDFNLRITRTRVVDGLETLESVGVDVFGDDSNGFTGTARLAVETLQNLGITWGKSNPAGPGGFYVYSLVSEDRTSADLLGEIRERAQSKFEKLRPKDGVRTLLAIWVNNSLWSGRAPMSFPVATFDGEDLELPDGCYGVVTIRQPFGPSQKLAWTYGRETSWLMASGWSDVSHRYQSL